MTHWWASFPELSDQEEPALKQVLKSGLRVTAEQGDIVILTGDAVSNYLLGIEGCVRVQSVTESGREIVL